MAFRKNRKIVEEKIGNLIDILQENYLIRREWRSGSQWYQLTHDRFIGPIKDSNRKWEYDKKIKSYKTKLRIVIPTAIVLIAIIMGVVIYNNSLDKLNIREIDVGNRPYIISLDPTANMLYVSNFEDGTVSIIDLTTKATTTPRVGNGPMGIAINSETNRSYIA